jgi:hypothetical protein
MDQVAMSVLSAYVRYRSAVSSLAGPSTDRVHYRPWCSLRRRSTPRSVPPERLAQDAHGFAIRSATPTGSLRQHTPERETTGHRGARAVGDGTPEVGGSVMPALPILSVDATARHSPESDVTIRSITVIVGVVIALTFLFGFGNVLDLALRLGVPVFIAPLVAPAVDLSVVGLLVATRFLAVRGASHAQLRPARRLLIFTSAATLALNVIDPLVAGHLG